MLACFSGLGMQCVSYWRVVVGDSVDIADYRDSKFPITIVTPEKIVIEQDPPTGAIISSTG